MNQDITHEKRTFLLANDIDEKAVTLPELEAQVILGKSRNDCLKYLTPQSQS